MCGLLLAALLIAQQWMPVPLWLWAGALALAPQAGTLVLASASARSGDVVRAAALRSGPALIMVGSVVTLADKLAWFGQGNDAARIAASA